MSKFIFYIITERTNKMSVQTFYFFLRIQEPVEKPQKKKQKQIEILNNRFKFMTDPYMSISSTKNIFCESEIQTNY